MAAQGPRYTYFSAATSAVTNRFVTSTNMKIGAYTVANSGAMPTAGARHVTVTATAGATADTMGTLVVVGTDLDGVALTETLTPATAGIVTGSEWFVTVTSVTGAGWVIDAVEVTNDTLVVGCTAAAAVADTDGVLRSVTIGESAAGAITLTDSSGTVGVLKASITEGTYAFDVQYSGYLTVTAAAASKLTVSTS